MRSAHSRDGFKKLEADVWETLGISVVYMKTTGPIETMRAQPLWISWTHEPESRSIGQRGTAMQIPGFRCVDCLDGNMMMRPAGSDGEWDH